MISIDEIDKTILELEAKDTSYAVVERLAWLYIVRDHISPKIDEIRLDSMQGSEILEACSNKSYLAVMSVFQEHFDIIKAVYPKEYTAILNKLNEL